MTQSPDEPRDAQTAAFVESIDECLELYRSSADAWNQSLSAEAAARSGDKTLTLMEDLARGLMVKVFLTIVRADRRFSAGERRLALVLLEKLWGRKFQSSEIGTVMQGLVPLADKFDWYRLLRPFEEVPSLADRVGDVETIVMRLANIVAKCDGTLSEEESLQLKGLLAEIHRHLRPVPLGDEPLVTAVPGATELDELPPVPIGVPVAEAVQPAPAARPADRADGGQAPGGKAPGGKDRLAAALASLDELIGLDSIKAEVRELARFLQVQQHREEAGLPRTQVSLHTVFVGNPGTGKTSVARILGEVFGALEIVKRGHLIEADRSSLVAGYMGQTAAKTNKVVDQALDGVLFIDEAYSLINEEGDDPYGHEAVQILLKRMEDHRDRLIVILAGYPGPMRRLLAANPGLSSRFNRTLTFADYSTLELCRIFGSLCERNHYELPAATRARLALGFAHLVARRDEHFGNGRLVRNVFEHAIRRLANRVADVLPLTRELLTRLEPQDVLLEHVPETSYDAEAAAKLRLSITCNGCGQSSRLRGTHLGRRVQCRKCQTSFAADWGTPLADDRGK